MSEIEKAMINADLPKLEVNVGVFKHKETGQFGFCVMGVKTGLTDSSRFYIYDASKWERLEDYVVEGTDRIQEAFHNDMYLKFKEENYELGEFKKHFPDEWALFKRIIAFKMKAKKLGVK